MVDGWWYIRPLAFRKYLVLQEHFSNIILLPPCIKKTMITQRYKVEFISVGACVSGCARASYDDAACTSAAPHSETDHVERESRSLLISTLHQHHTPRPTPSLSA
jgi:hypothetical protein